MNCRVVIWGSVAALGVLLAVAGIVLTQIGSDIIETLVHQKLDLSDPESDGYKYFIKPPVPVQVNFTFFHVTNPDAVLTGVKPNLEERGPYVFIEHREKKKLSWNEADNAAYGQFVRFGQYKYYSFLAEKSCAGCNATDQVTIANMPLLGLIGKAQRMGGTSGPKAMAKIAAAACKGNATFQKTCTNWEEMGFDGIFFTQTVEDFVLKGIKTGTAGWMLGMHGDGKQKDITYITDRLPITVFDRDNGFALFNHRNNTMENEWYEVETEQESWDRRSLITKWGQKTKELHSEDNLLTNLDGANAASFGHRGDRWWNGQADIEGNKLGNSTCNILRGTDGNQFHPGVKKEQDLWIFNTAPCRSVYLVHTREVDVEGIPTLEYAVPLDGANINKTINVCACQSLSKYNADNLYNTEGSCIKREPADSDTLDLTACEPTVTTGCADGIQDLYHCQGASTTLSYPHFYLAEDQLKHFTGLMPVPELHRLYLNVEPHTGMTLKLHSRIQLNVPLFKESELDIGDSPVNYGLPFLKSVPSIPHFPILWIDLGADVESDPKLVDKLLAELVTPIQILEIGQWVAIGVGAALIVISGFMSIIGPWKCRQTSV